MIFDRKLHAARASLPENYEKKFSMDLQNDKKTMLTVNIAAVAVAAVMFVAAYIFIPLTSMYAGETLSVVLLKLGVLLISYAAYIVLHELVHGIAMRYYGSKNVRYGFTGLYAYAGSSDYFDRASYLVISLAPIVFWGIVLLILNIALPVRWFWVVYFIQMGNISGAAGDVYVTVKMLRSPKGLLVNDTGVSMTVYGEAKIPE